MLMAKFKAVGNETGYPTAGEFGGSCCSLRLKGLVCCLEAWREQDLSNPSAAICSKTVFGQEDFSALRTIGMRTSCRWDSCLQ